MACSENRFVLIKNAKAKPKSTSPPSRAATRRYPAQCRICSRPPGSYHRQLNPHAGSAGGASPRTNSTFASESSTMRDAANSGAVRGSARRAARLAILSVWCEPGVSGLNEPGDAAERAHGQTRLRAEVEEHRRPEDHHQAHHAPRHGRDQEPRAEPGGPFAILVFSPATRHA